MKKNNMFRIASVLLVAVLLSTCVISGAFAKYTTSGEIDDHARVAKFGITVEAEGDIFANEYNALEGKDYAATITKTVIGLDGADTDNVADDVVAPGTSGALGSYAINGIAEVAVNVKAEATLTMTGWVVDSKPYCPIVITVAGVDYDFSECTDETEFNDKVAEIEAAIEMNRDFAPNTLFGADDENDETNETDLTKSITWSWAYETLDSGVADADVDKNDTALGQLPTAPTISLEVVVTVTQLD